MIEKVYIDTCALNRLADDHTQPRIRQEAEAMVRIFDLVAACTLFWSASSVIRFEIQRNPDPVRRLGALKLLSNASEIVTPNAASIQRAEALASTGLQPLDALHLATAEQSGVDWLITTDDRFLKQVRIRFETQRPEPINPVDWIQRRHPWLLPNPPSSAT
jgi:predicted nucleic acid-binding protein